MAHDLRKASSALREIEELAEAGLTAQQLLEQSGPLIDSVVPTDGYFLGATDPETSLVMGAGVVHDLPLDQCAPTWDYEFLVPDYLKFNDIADSGRVIGDLHEETGGKPMRSPRWREFGAATGFRSEVRATFTAGTGLWGIGQFDRLGDAPPFSDPEKAWLAQVSPLIARGLRRAMAAHSESVPASRGPGVLLLDPAGAVVSATSEAAAWLDEIEGIPTGTPIPLETQAYASRVRAGADGDAAVPTGRVRTRSGVWLLMHGSLLEGTDQLALVIEPAKAADIAPLIVEAYGLSQREVDVTKLIARGLGTSEIAATLFLSPHTVRDHIKAVFEKAGVSSRGELVAKVFADHYSPPMAHV
ncbi:MAG TPA: helix-turn-helix transcriptional regulator [Solirubrobacteraceae bacterium]|jgi:DNA-binding CsgD family transcriptional regulator